MVGQLNVLLPGKSYRKTNGKKINWINVCLFLWVLERPVGENEILDEFRRYGMTKTGFRRSVQRHKCIERVENRIYQHNNDTHEIGQLKGGVYKENVLRSRAKKSLPPWFRLDLEFEIHGEVLTSPKNVFVCDRSIKKQIPYDWIHCNFLVQITDGHVTVIQQPKYRGHKFGLNKDRYLEYRKYVDLVLGKYFGYPIELITIRFDLHQDDHTQPYYLKGGKIDAVMGVLGLQEYPVIREDKAAHPIRRRELNVWNWDGVQVVPQLQEVLTRNAATLQASYTTTKLNETTRESQKFLNKLLADILPALNSVVRENSANVTMVGEFMAELFHQNFQNKEEIISKVNEFAAALDDKLGITLATFGRTIDDLSFDLGNLREDQREGNVFLQQMVDQGEVAIQQRHENNLLLEENNQLQVTQISKLDDLVDEVRVLRKQFNSSRKTWRKVAKRTKLELLQKMQDEHDLTFRAIQMLLEPYFEVTQQALSKLLRDNSIRTQRTNRNGRTSGNFQRTSYEGPKKEYGESDAISYLEQLVPLATLEGHSKDKSNSVGNFDHGYEALWSVDGETISSLRQLILEKVESLPGCSKNQIAKSVKGIAYWKILLLIDLMVAEGRLNVEDDPKHSTRFRYYLCPNFGPMGSIGGDES